MTFTPAKIYGGVLLHGPGAGAAWFIEEFVGGSDVYLSPGQLDEQVATLSGAQGPCSGTRVVLSGGTIMFQGIGDRGTLAFQFPDVNFITVGADMSIPSKYFSYQVSWTKKPAVSTTLLPSTL